MLYVIRDLKLEGEYCTEHGHIGELIYDAPYQGQAFEVDSFRVLQVLKQWTSGGTAETYVDTTNDIQTAWNNLMSIYEGVDAKSVIV